MRLFHKGFTLVEMMIAVAIVGILTAIALPAYTDNVRKGRRADVQQYMMQEIGALERIYSRQGKYPSAHTFQSNDYYAFTYTPDGDTKFTISAAPTGSQAEDSCGTLTVNHQGITTPTTSGCWP
jgi:type IV pilus assembly protein PilE